MKKRQGFALLTVIFIMLVFAVLAAILATLIISGSRSTVDDYRYDKAFYIAEAGKNFAIKHISAYPDWTQNMEFPISKSFAGGYFTLSTTNETRSTLTLYSTGIITVEGATYTRVVRAGVKIVGSLGSNAFFSFGDIDIGENATINGDVSAIRAVNIDPPCTISGTVEAHVDYPENPPTLEVTYYDGEIATAAMTAEGDKIYDIYDDTTLLSGTHYVHGNMTFNNGANITVSGSAEIIATGTVTVNKDVKFGNCLTIISSGKVTIDQKVNIGAGGLWYSSVGISLVGEVGVGEVVVDSGTVFLTPGYIDFENNADFSGLLFAGGTVSFKNNAHINGNVVAGYIDVKNNAFITLNGDLVDFNSVIGLSGSLAEEKIIKVIEWSEVY